MNQEEYYARMFMKDVCLSIDEVSGYDYSMDHKAWVPRDLVCLEAEYKEKVDRKFGLGSYRKYLDLIERYG